MTDKKQLWCAYICRSVELPRRSDHQPMVTETSEVIGTAYANNETLALGRAEETAKDLGTLQHGNVTLTGYVRNTMQVQLTWCPECDSSLPGPDAIVVDAEQLLDDPSADIGAGTRWGVLCELCWHALNTDEPDAADEHAARVQDENDQTADDMRGV